MTRYTINLSRARMAGRNKRAKKAMSILREELERREGEVRISGDVNAEVWKRGARKPPAKIAVEVVERDGAKIAELATQEETRQENAAEEAEEEEVEEEPEEETETDYEDIVSGTVSEAKDRIRELEDPDYEALLDAEKANKDRKTLKEFLEGKMN